MRAQLRGLLREQRSVAAGLAVGCMCIGVGAVHRRGPFIDAAFGLAWNAWAPAVWFPAMPPLPAGHLYRMADHLLDSDRQKTVYASWRAHGDWLIPQLGHDDWTLAATAAGVIDPALVDLRAWSGLARTFVGALRPL